jgi:hypothetical protein
MAYLVEHAVVALGRVLLAASLVAVNMLVVISCGWYEV